jgi:hypothetical protein
VVKLTAGPSSDIEHNHELRRARQDEDHFLICMCLDSHDGFLLRLDGSGPRAAGAGAALRG